MDDPVRAALARTQTIDLTTTGRRSGEPRRIEIMIHNLDGRLIISGMPAPGRTRAWIHNIQANPAVTVHLKSGGVVADVEGTARVVSDPAERRPLLEGVARNWNRSDIDVMMDHSPLIEVTLPGYPA
jgi:deazaflavin-dependent oxidoreductase (nitroreductase family)